MALQNSTEWQEQFSNLPRVADTGWKANLTSLIDTLTSGRLTSLGLLNSAGQPALSFTFASSAFENALTDNQASTIANAFEAAWLASTFVVPSGSYFSPQSNATTFSLVSLCAPVPASIAVAKSMILPIANQVPVSDAALSQVPVIIRSAFLSITITTTGLDSTPPIGGPLPLVDTARSLQ